MGALGLPVPKEIHEAMKGMVKMQQDIAEMRELLARLVELHSENSRQGD